MLDDMLLLLEARRFFFFFDFFLFFLSDLGVGIFPNFGELLTCIG